MERIQVEELINFKMLPFDIFNERGDKLIEAGEILTQLFYVCQPIQL